MTISNTGTGTYPITLTAIQAETRLDYISSEDGIDLYIDISRPETRYYFDSRTNRLVAMSVGENNV